MTEPVEVITELDVREIRNVYRGYGADPKRTQINAHMSDGRNIAYITMDRELYLNEYKSAIFEANPRRRSMPEMILTRLGYSHLVEAKSTDLYADLTDYA